MDGYAGGDNYIWRIGVCGKVGEIVRCDLGPWMPHKSLVPRYVDLQISQVTCIWFGWNKMYANMYVDVCSSHTGFGKCLHGSWDGSSMAKFYFDEHVRYRKRKDITVISVQNIVTSKHATYLEFPPLGFEPRTDLWSLTTQDLVKTSPRGIK